MGEAVMLNSKESVPCAVLEVPGCEGLSIKVYGLVKAANLQQKMEQAYYVELNGQKVVRAELLDREKRAINDLLKATYPEHVNI